MLLRNERQSWKPRIVQFSARSYVPLINLIGDLPLKLHWKWKDLKAVGFRHLILAITCGILFSFAVTSATYFYSFEHDLFNGGIQIYRGWPWPWSMERIGGVGVIDPLLPSSAPYFAFQALNFLIDLVLWMTISLLPSSLYLYRTKLHLR